MTVREFLEKVNLELGKPEMQERRIVQIACLGRVFDHGREVSGVGFYLCEEPGRPEAAREVCIVDRRCEDR